jgi:hypothetical protein
MSDRVHKNKGEGGTRGLVVRLVYTGCESLSCFSVFFSRAKEQALSYVVFGISGVLVRLHQSTNVSACCQEPIVKISAPSSRILLIL